MKSRILVLTPRYPYPPIGGDRLRIHHICSALANRYELTLASLCESKEELEHRPDTRVFRAVHRVYLPRWKSYLTALRALPGSVPLQLAYYWSTRFDALVRKLAPEHDAVLAHLIRTAQYVDPSLGIPRILEMTDAMSMTYARMNRLPDAYTWLKFVYSREERRVERYERKVVENFQRTWLVSEIDGRFLGFEPGSFEVIPNGVNLDQYPFLRGGAGDVILFIGNMVSAQNQDACFHFATRILPLIRQSRRIRFRVAGNCPEHISRRLQGIDGVEVYGQFEKAAEVVRDVFCGVCPVRAGAGIQNKMLEYMALGIPAVASTVGAEGIEGTPGKDLLVYSDEAQACATVLRLHRDPVLRLRIAESGLRVVKGKYGWNRIYNEFVSSVDEVMRKDLAQILVS